MLYQNIFGLLNLIYNDMKYLKLFESINNYWKIDYSEYKEAVFDIQSPPNPNKDVVSLTYRQQESIIGHFSKNYRVVEGLDSELFIDNVVVVGFNHPVIVWKAINVRKTRSEVSCWINIRNVKKYRPTKKHLAGREESTNTSIYISKLEDEWFYIEVKGGLKQRYQYYISPFQGFYYRCDQFDGLIQLLNDI